MEEDRAERDCGVEANSGAVVYLWVVGKGTFTKGRNESIFFW